MTALVTGGADGIGAGITERLAREGMRVVIADLDEEAGDALAARVGGSFVRADVATSAGVRAAVDAACRLPGRMGVLVNNAGGIEDPCLPAADPAKWEGTLPSGSPAPARRRGGLRASEQPVSYAAHRAGTGWPGRWPRWLRGSRAAR